MLNNPRNSVLLTEPTVAQMVNLPSHLKIHSSLHNSHTQQPILSHLELVCILRHSFISSYNVSPRVTGGWLLFVQSFQVHTATLVVSTTLIKNFPTKTPSD